MKNPVSFRLSAALVAGLIVGLLAGYHTMVPQSRYDETNLMANETDATVDDTSPNLHPKEIYAHYMGCFPSASRATGHERTHIAPNLRHDNKNPPTDARGGRFYNWDLINPKHLSLELEEGVGLDIERAVRGGFDGFALDAWAGGENAKVSLDALFAYAEKHCPNFKITLCMDPTCLGWSEKDNGLPTRPHAFVEAIRYMLDRHGDSPNLAKRDGKILIFNYLSCFMMNGPKLTKDNWHLIKEGFDLVEKELGQDIYWHFDANEMSYGLSGAERATKLEAYEWAAKNFDAVGEFINHNLAGVPELAEIVKANGAEYSHPLWHQYDNRTTGTLTPPTGFDWLRRNWEMARETGSTLIQYITWNDYGEDTHIVPGYDTNYALLELNRYFIEWWKLGHEPRADSDQIYIAFKKHPQDAPVYPFLQRESAKGALEVLTILKKPGRVVVPGRDDEGWDAPAGLSFKQLPVEPGTVRVEVRRNGSIDLELEAPEIITDRPFRVFNTIYTFSTECVNHWNIDFPGEPFLAYSEYGDADGNGLPNWFEMYWFGKWLDFETQTGVNPNASAAGDGISNLEKYLAQQNPLVPQRQYVAGDTWTQDQVCESGQIWNPDKDFAENRVWHYVYQLGEHHKIPHNESAEWQMMDQHGARGQGGYFYHCVAGRRDGYGFISHLKREGEDGRWRLLLKPAVEIVVGVAWECPISGCYSFSGKLEAYKSDVTNSITFLALREGETLNRVMLKHGEKGDFVTKNLELKKGEVLYFIADVSPGGDHERMLVDDFEIVLETIADE